MTGHTRPPWPIQHTGQLVSIKGACVHDASNTGLSTCPIPLDLQEMMEIEVDNPGRAIMFCNGQGPMMFSQFQ